MQTQPCSLEALTTFPSEADRPSGCQVPGEESKAQGGVEGEEARAPEGRGTGWENCRSTALGWKAVRMRRALVVWEALSL